jgi:hypothetical protein
MSKIQLTDAERIELLESRVRALESKTGSALLSDSLLKRSFAVMGYSAIAGMIMSIVVLIISMVLGPVGRLFYFFSGSMR